MNPQDHTRLTIYCVTLLSMIAMGCGAYLLLKGFQSGELLAQMASSGLSGLIGFLGGKMSNSKPQVTDPAKVETVTTETKDP